MKEGDQVSSKTLLLEARKTELLRWVKSLNRLDLKHSPEALLVMDQKQVNLHRDLDPRLATRGRALPRSKRVLPRAALKTRYGSSSSRN